MSGADEGADEHAKDQRHITIDKQEQTNTETNPNAIATTSKGLETEKEKIHTEMQCLHDDGERPREEIARTKAIGKMTPQVHTKPRTRKKLHEKLSPCIIKSTRRMANTSGPDKLHATPLLKDQKML